MFTIKAPESFEATLTIVGQGREQKLGLTFRHKTKSAYLQMIEDIRDEKLSPADAIVEIVIKWDADVEFSKESVTLLQENQPGSDWAIITGYGDALGVTRKGN